MMGILTWLSKTHTWLLPVFAVGLGAPRWCQMLWGTSSLALYIPWAGHAGPYLGISLWLWLGVLDAVQGVGLGMILLQTLSRLHVCATLAFAQIIGSVCVMVARATAPNRIGPESVFPDAAKWDFHDGLKGSPLASAPFWIALICQIVIVIGYFWFYRKEQLGMFTLFPNFPTSFTDFLLSQRDHDHDIELMSVKGIGLTLDLVASLWYADFYYRTISFGEYPWTVIITTDFCILVTLAALATNTLATFLSTY